MQSQETHVYVINGLGNDEAVANLLGLSGYHHTFLEWYDAYDSESLKIYVKRLKWQIKASCPILIGISFGGLIAMELGKILDTEKIILISSPASRKDLPTYAKITGGLGLHKLMPVNMTFTGFFLDKVSARFPEDFRLMMRNTIKDDYDNVFVKWALDKFLTWRGRNVPEGVVQIHGTADEFINHKKMNGPILVPKGRHLMVFSHSKVIATELHKLLPASAHRN